MLARLSFVPSSLLARTSSRTPTFVLAAMTARPLSSAQVAQPLSDVFENAAHGHTSVLASQIVSRADILHLPDDSGLTLLHLAARYGHVSTVRMLLEKGADPSKRSSDGKTAAQMADFWGHEEVSHLLASDMTNKVASIQHQQPEDKTLSRRKAIEYQHAFFAGSLLNRQSHLRPNADAITKLFQHSATRFMIFHKLRPLLSNHIPSMHISPIVAPSSSATVNSGIACLLSRADMTRLLLVNANVVATADLSSPNSLQSDAPAVTSLSTQQLNPSATTWEWPLKLHAEGVIFLGEDEMHDSVPYFAVELSEIEVSLPINSLGVTGDKPYRTIKGVQENVLLQVFPHAILSDMRASIPILAKHESYALAVATQPVPMLSKEANSNSSHQRLPYTSTSLLHSALAAQARGILDWNMRNQYCAACSRKTISFDVGYKRACPPIDITKDKNLCISQREGAGVQNFQYPRTDPVVIICVISPDGRKALLGRQKVWPKGMYSCVAGFMEAGESIEEACRREVFEETGVVVGPVQYIRSQPWPFPNHLMIGCIGEALTEVIDLRDKELEHAAWFTHAELTDALKQSVLYRGPDTNNDSKTAYISITIKTPPPTAIAHVLLREWAEQWTISDAMRAKI